MDVASNGKQIISHCRPFTARSTLLLYMEIGVCLHLLITDAYDFQSTRTDPILNSITNPIIFSILSKQSNCSIKLYKKSKTYSSYFSPTHITQPKN